MVRRWISTLRMASPEPRDAGQEEPRNSRGEASSTQHSGFSVRRATTRDVRVLAALWREMMEFHRTLDSAFEFGSNAQTSIERHLSETIRSVGGRVFVAEAEGRIIGYILGEVQDRKPIYPAGRYGFISDLAVTEPWRRRGVGRALVTAQMEWFRQLGVTAVELFILETNPVSSAFWQSMGFRHYLRLLRQDLDADPSTQRSRAPEGDA